MNSLTSDAASKKLLSTQGTDACVGGRVVGKAHGRVVDARRASLRNPHDLDGSGIRK